MSRRRPTQIKLPSVSDGFGAGDCALDFEHACRRIALDFEVPEPQHAPTQIRELMVDALVSLTVARDLSIPELAGLTVVIVGVAVPECSVDEDA